MPSTTKVCAVCKQDCSAKPRVKDPAGRYFCKACHATLQSQVAKQPQAAVAPAQQQDQDLDWNTDDLASLQAIDTTESTFATCPSCSSPMGRAAIICPGCGFNKTTGKKPKPVKQAAESARILSADTVAALWFENPLVWCAAALVGAAIGAAIWIYVMVSTGYELSLIGVVLGGSTGLAVALVARHRMTWGTGALAAAVALATVVGSRYYGIKLIAESEIAKIVASISISADDAKLDFQIDTTRKWLAEGKAMKWPSDPHPPLDEIEDASELPTEAVLAADTLWASQSDQWREDYRAALEAKYKADFTALGHTLADDYAKDELTAIHMPEESSGGYSMRGRGIGLIIGVVWPYAMPLIAAFFAYKCASGDWIEYEKPD